ncbi:MAG: hypothetical protein LBJ86_00200 [Spirochaetaceae bacterium]|jgi:hypothetical protein|nr:hypothetical protein [Spirochaetaceae bacterium]
MNWWEKNDPEVYAGELYAGKITMEATAAELERIAEFCCGVLSGEIRYGLKPTQITAEERYEKADRAARILRTYLAPSLDADAVKSKLTKVKDELKDVRNKAIAGKCEKKNALALLDMICGDFKNEVTNMFRDVLKPYLGTLYNDDEFSRRISTTIDADAGIAGIRAQIERMPESAPDTQAPQQRAATDLIDMDCIKKLVDTGFIAQNTNIKDRTVYAKTRAATSPKIYKELLKMTNDGERAERIMINYISGVEAGLKQYLSRLKTNNKK